MTFDGLFALVCGITLLWAFAGLRASERTARDYIALAFQRRGQYAALSAHCTEKRNEVAPQKRRAHDGQPHTSFCHTSLLWIVGGGWQEVCASAFSPYHTKPRRWFLIRSECGFFKGGERAVSFTVIHLLEKL